VSFLAPLWLGLAAAAAVPVVLHLLRRRHGTRVEFPAVRFLVQAEQEHRNETRLRHLLLLAARVAAVLLLAVAAARPLGPSGGSGHAPTALVLVVDNSLRSAAAPGGVSYLAALQREAQALVDRSLPDDRVWLVTADGQVTAGADGVRGAVGRLTPLAGRGDLPAAITRAAALAQASGLAATHVVVVSDGRRAAFPEPALADGVPVTVVVPPLAPVADRALIGAEPTTPRWGPWGSVRITARTPDSADVRVVLDAQTVARGTVPPEGQLTVRVRAPTDGWLAGRVEFAPDELRGDDVRHFAIVAGPPPMVRVDASAGPFAAGAVATLVDLAQLRSGPAISVVAAERLASRPALIVAPESPVVVGAANRALAAAAVPWRLGALRRDTARAVGATLTGVVVRERYELVAAGADSGRVLATAGGRPWIVAGEGYVVVASPLSGSASDLPVSAPFVPWLAQVVQSVLVTDGGVLVEAGPGGPVAFPVAVDELIGPDGSARTVTASWRRAPDSLGVYWLRHHGRTVGALVVNPEPDATDPAPLGAAAAVARGTNGPVAVVPSGTAAADRAFTAGAPRPVAALFLTLLLLALLGEGWLARPPRRTASS
jgi:hypothetical protein